MSYLLDFLKRLALSNAPPEVYIGEKKGEGELYCCSVVCPIPGAEIAGDTVRHDPNTKKIYHSGSCAMADATNKAFKGKGVRIGLEDMSREKALNLLKKGELNQPEQPSDDGLVEHLKP